MGRDTLDAAIRSVLSQSLPASEIIVVAGAPPKISIENLSKVKLIKNYERDKAIWTAAHNRNVGVRESNSDYVAFLDDDDLWHEDKMSIQIEYLLANPNSISITSALYQVRSWVQYKRPLKRIKKGQSILTANYGKKRFLPIPFYTPTPAIVVPTKIIKAIPFDESLPGFEDTWWLHEIQDAGYQIFQHKRALVTVNANPIRSISRDTVEKNIAWAKKLFGVDRKLATNYLKGICMRNALISRRWKDFKIYSQSLEVLEDDLYKFEISHGIKCGNI